MTPLGRAFVDVIVALVPKLPVTVIGPPHRQREQRIRAGRVGAGPAAEAESWPFGRRGELHCTPVGDEVAGEIDRGIRWDRSALVAVAISLNWRARFAVSVPPARLPVMG